MRTVIQAIDAFPSLVAALVPFPFPLITLFFSNGVVVSLFMSYMVSCFCSIQVDFVMEILSKLVSKQVRVSSSSAIWCCALFQVDVSVLVINMARGYLMFLCILTAGVENAKTMVWILEMCITDTAAFFPCIVTGITSLSIYKF